MSKEPVQLKGKDLEWVRQELIESQDGICILCERSFEEFPEMIACVDHCHQTGFVRAALCLNCNGMAGKVEQRAIRAKQELTYVEWLDNLMLYLKAEQTHYIHPSEAPKPRKLKKNAVKKLNKLYREKYPKKKKDLVYPKSGKCTAQFKKLFEEFNFTEEDYLLK